MKADEAVDFELARPRPDDDFDCCAAVGGPMAAKAAGKSQTFDAAVSIHRKLPEMVDRRKELIFGMRTSSAPVPRQEWSYSPATWPKVADELVEAIKEPFEALTRRPSSSYPKPKALEGFARTQSGPTSCPKAQEGIARTQSTPTPCNTPVGGSGAARHEIPGVSAAGGDRGHVAPHKPTGYRTHHWTHTELGPGSGGQHHGRKKKKEQLEADDESMHIPHRPHVPVEEDLYQVEMRLRHLDADKVVIL